MFQEKSKFRFLKRLNNNNNNNNSNFRRTYSSTDKSKKDDNKKFQKKKSNNKISKKEYRARLLASLSRTSTGRWVPPFPPPQKIKRKELKELKESEESKEFKEKTRGRNKKSKKKQSTKSPKKFNPNKKPKMRWTEEEDNYLLSLIKIHGENWEKLSEILEQESWKKIKELFPNRTIQELKNNYFQYGSLNPKSDKPIVNVGMWSKQELKRFEKALDKYANNFKEYELDDFNELWINISNEVKTRSERQCRKMYYWQHSRPYDYERIKFHNK
ncbi:10979_t:CDS:2 [Diversispora eburnea]|uniref:10979_t:CDS:1 n=1 Tax=Diversispora eburnea TaxID=1213867 RepID=A0A9N9ARD1_9GLOM|nr:10979_t:CDS:2 [Diversispora eburnea]